MHLDTKQAWCGDLSLLPGCGCDSSVGDHRADCFRAKLRVPLVCRWAADGFSSRASIMACPKHLLIIQGVSQWKRHSAAYPQCSLSHISCRLAHCVGSPKSQGQRPSIFSGSQGRCPSHRPRWACTSGAVCSWHYPMVWACTDMQMHP